MHNRVWRLVGSGAGLVLCAWLGLVWLGSLPEPSIPAGRPKATTTTTSPRRTEPNLLYRTSGPVQPAVQPALPEGHLPWAPGFLSSATAVAFSPDSRRAVTGHREGELRTWDPALRDPLRGVRTPVKMIRAVAYSADGKLILSA